MYMYIYVYVTRRNIEDNYDLLAFGIKMLAASRSGSDQDDCLPISDLQRQLHWASNWKNQNQNPLIGKFCDCSRKDTVLLSNSHYLFKFFFSYITSLKSSVLSMRWNHMVNCPRAVLIEKIKSLITIEAGCWEAALIEKSVLGEIDNNLSW